MDYIFQNIRIFAGAYIDGILVYTNTLEEQLQALRKGNDKLREGSFFAGPDKCTLAQPEVEYCGLILGRHCIRPQPVKLSGIRSFGSCNAIDVLFQPIGPRTIGDGAHDLLVAKLLQ